MSSSPGLPSPSTFFPASKTATKPKSSLAEKENVQDDIQKPQVISVPSSPVDSPNIPFPDLAGNFAYASTRTVSPERAPLAEAPTKRRRLDFAYAATLAPVARKHQTLARPKEAEARNRSKSPTKKRPQTITALATAAYRPQEEQLTKESVSEFFPQSKRTTTKKAKSTDDVEKVKKPRKPRAKAAAKDTATTTKKAAAPKKSRKANARDLPPKQPLYSPEKANAQIRSQGFLFGTSSQLAATESPTFIREMQRTLHYSEPMIPGSPQNSLATVPTAPQRTSLLICQASRGLWGTGSRDLQGGMCRSIVTSTSSRPRVDAPAVAEREHIGVQGSRLADMRREASNEPRQAAAELTSMKPLEESEQPRQVNDSNIAPSKPQEAVALKKVGQQEFVDIDDYFATQQGPNLVKQPVISSTPRYRLTDTFETQGLTQPNTNTLLSDMIDLDDIPPSTQQVKTKKAARKPATKPAITTTTKSATTAKAATVPKAAKAIKPSFSHGDGILDDEPNPSPSPPRRKRTKATPAAKTLTLSPSRGTSVSADPTESALGVTAMVKPGDSQWKQIAPLLYPKITRAVKSTPKSKNLDGMTWHEKILLYDPIILEDFTAWLNETGVSIMVTRQKRKTSAKKGRKKKQPAAENDIEALPPFEPVDPPPVVFEIVEETLQPWMVQKWCEDNSICCCLKETMRGGSRARY